MFPEDVSVCQRPRNPRCTRSEEISGFSCFANLTAQKERNVLKTEYDCERKEETVIQDITELAFGLVTLKLVTAFADTTTESQHERA